MPRIKELKIDPTKHILELEMDKEDAAQEVCWKLMIMMQVGLLDIPEEEREMLAKPMKKWSDLHFYIESWRKKNGESGSKD